MTTFEQGHTFKFIELTEKIEDHSGIKADDGIIRIVFRWGKRWRRQDGFQPVTAFDYAKNNTYASSLRSLSASGGMAQAQNISCPSAPANNIGITVPGSVSDQRFQTVDNFALEPEKHVIVLRLLGKTADTKVKAPVTVTTKKCPTSGKKNNVLNKFCAECGTGLTVV